MSIAARCLAAILLAPTPLIMSTEAAIAQTAAPIHRLPDGKPDLQGVWEARWRTMLERQPGVKGLVMPPDQVAGYLAAGEAGRARRPGHSNPDSDFDMPYRMLQVRGEYRTSLIIDPPDGKMPLTDEGKRRAALANGDRADNPEDRLFHERCIAGQGRAPMVAPPTNAYIQIVQPPGAVMVLSEILGEVRAVRPGEPAAAKPFPTFNGDADARWEGDTLVVTTRNMRDDSRFAGPFIVLMLSPQSVVEERFTPVDADSFVYRYTLSDPLLYRQPWTAETTYLRSPGRLYEFACHEGNYALTNILRRPR